MKKTYKNRDILYKLYIVDGLSQENIGAMFGVTCGTISYYLHKYDIPVSVRHKTINNTQCLTCGSITQNPKFCSISCAAKYNNKKSPKRENKEKLPNCLNCNGELTRRSKQFCNRNCQHEYIYKKYIEAWLEGTETGSNGNKSIGISSHVRRYVLEQADYKCEECGVGSVWNGKPLTLQIDHIDGNYKNNKPGNHRVLCPNCHTQTSTYGNRNAGNGRTHNRRSY